MKKIRQLLPKTLFGWIKLCVLLGLVGLVSGIILIAAVLFYFAGQVPDLKALEDYKPLQVTKVYSDDGTLLAEFAKERRQYAPYNEIPAELIQAFLAAEDTGFYQHGGFDLKAIIRAALTNVLTNKKHGASTITQQVAKTFLLTNERTYTRKIKELILARRIEQTFTKDEILTLYLNQIFFGHGAYGIVAAADAYYNRTLDELTIQQRAMLAGLPKAPSAYDPVRNPTVARLRRDVIIRRMQAENFITTQEAEEAIASDLATSPRYLERGRLAPHFAEHIRRELYDTYGEKILYTAGMSVITTLDIEMQRAAQRAVIRGLREYDRRHGYRGPIGRVTLMNDWQGRIEAEAENWKHTDFGQPAAVLAVDDVSATIGLAAGVSKTIPLDLVKWARRYLGPDERGPRVRRVAEVLDVGDIIVTKPLTAVLDYQEGGYAELRRRGDVEQLYSLEQIPTVQAALVALDNRTGAIKAMVGGSDAGTGFNRATQAKRQAGSAIKPLVYAQALREGFTPASILLDAPVVLPTESGRWKPQNYTEQVYGPSPLRRGIEKSRNLMTIRLAQQTGIRDIVAHIRDYGLTGQLNPDLSTVLGSSDATVLDLTNAYRVYPNGGLYTPTHSKRAVFNAAGELKYSTLPTCERCQLGWSDPSQNPPALEVSGTQILSPGQAYQMTDMLVGVVERGTGWRARAVNHPTGGKTGTTNDYRDAWYIGFSPQYTVGVWVGFDRPQTMGDKETGSKAAAPIWTWFMQDVLENYRVQQFPVPTEVKFVRIDADTGTRPTPATQRTILEAFLPNQEPAVSSVEMPSGNGETTPIVPGLNDLGIY